MDLFFFFWFFFCLFLFIILGTLAYGGWSAAPWVPLWKKDIRRMMKLAKVSPKDIVYDLGAGDDRILIIAAKEFGAEAVGFEIATLPYLIAYIKIRLRGLKNKIQLKYRSFYNQNFFQADVICAFLTPQAMKKLKPKLEKETKSGCRIVSYAFKIPGWQPTIIDKPNKKTTAIYLYQR